MEWFGLTRTSETVWTDRRSGPFWTNRTSGPFWTARTSGPAWADKTSGSVWTNRTGGPVWTDRTSGPVRPGDVLALVCFAAGVFSSEPVTVIVVVLSDSSDVCHGFCERIFHRAVDLLPHRRVSPDKVSHR